MYTDDIVVVVRKLRMKGFSYTEIAEMVGKPIPKSSMSYMCKGLVLGAEANKRLNSLYEKQLHEKRLKALQANKQKVLKRMSVARDTGVGLTKSLDVVTLKISLAMLYWGEGSKYASYRGLSLGSSDPLMLRSYLRLLKLCYGIDTTSVRARIICRADQDTNALLEFWSESLRIPEENFYKTFEDPRTKGKPTTKSGYNGVCTLSCGTADIQLELQAIWESLASRISDD